MNATLKKNGRKRRVARLIFYLSTHVTHLPSEKVAIDSNAESWVAKRNGAINRRTVESY